MKIFIFTKIYGIENPEINKNEKCMSILMYFFFMFPEQVQKKSIFCYFDQFKSCLKPVMHIPDIRRSELLANYYLSM